jgi:hypothetical protein
MDILIWWALENGTEIDNWTFEELTAVVYEFQAYYGVPQAYVDPQSVGVVDPAYAGGEGVD